MHKINWKRDTRKYSNGYLGYVGKWCCFNLSWDGIGSDRSRTHTLRCMLPGIKDNLGNFDENAGKEMAASIVSHWFKNIEGE